jgi:phosphatidylglycerol:prolipoprotein diacylglycerol transferase
MHPILFKLGPLTIYTYGALVALGVLAAIGVAAWLAKKENLPPDKIMDLGVYLMAAAVIGSRLLYVIIEWRTYINSPLSVFKVWEGGLVFYGGFIACFLVIWWFIRRHQLSFWAVTDVYAVGLPLGHAIGRMGCFMAGCCYGKPTDSDWGVIFTNPKSLAPLDIHIHPTQLYEAAANLLIFLILLFFRRHKSFSGQVFLFYAMLYSSARFTIEFFRGDPRGGLGPLSTSQWVGIAVFILCGIWWWKKAAGRQGAKAAG